MFINNLFFKLRELFEVSPARRDRLIFVSFCVLIFLDLVTWVLVPLYFWKFKEFVVLQYNIYFGISSLGPWPILFFIPVSCLVVAAVNYSLSFYFFLKQKILSYFLAISALVFQIIMLAALVLIIYMNY